MTDFNYSEYSIDVLENAIANAQQAIKDRKYNAKRYTKNLTLHNGRGFSNEKKHMFKSYIKYSPALIAIHEKEIAECQAEIAIR
jgi:dTDP-4-amino-4,6-dideoxygalactose transaminase